jgi:hypothetical protein
MYPIRRSYALAPRATGVLPQLDGLVHVVDEEAELRSFETGETELEGLLGFVVAKDHYLMARSQIEASEFLTLVVWPGD